MYGVYVSLRTRIRHAGNSYLQANWPLEAVHSITVPTSYMCATGNATKLCSSCDTDWQAATINDQAKLFKSTLPQSVAELCQSLIHLDPSKHQLVHCIMHRYY